MVGAAVAIVLAWLIGYITSGVDASTFVAKVLPGSVTIDRSGEYYIGRNAAGAVVGYAGEGRGAGYGGPMRVVVGVSPAGDIIGIEMVEERESPGFFRLIRSSKLFPSYVNRSIQGPLQLGQDLDGVTGATRSAEGVATAVRDAVRGVAADALKTPLPPPQTRLEVGAPEIILVLLFVSGYVGHKLRAPKVKRAIRWGTLIAGMITIGFLYTLPLTISMVVALLSGFWPDWQTNLYWYLLIGGIIFTTIVTNKNAYCSWFCPFGAFQECLAAVTRVKASQAHGLHQPLKWLQRVLALLAILIGLALRNPGYAGYEPFATLFDLRGTTVQWALLLIVVMASLMMYRPFCNYLCPLDPVLDFLGAGRRWVRDTWKNRSR